MRLGPRCDCRTYHSQQSQLIVVSLLPLKRLRMKQLFYFLFLLFVLTGCEIREEYNFKEDGSGVYQMSFDLTEFMNMNEEIDSTAAEQKVDTVINFASFLDEKRDSIAQLSPEKQEQLELLRPLQFEMKVNDSTQQMLMNLRYSFKKLEDLDQFAKAVEQADIESLKDITQSENEGEATAETDSTKQDQPDVFSMAESFDTYFGRDKFSRMITEEARLRAVEQKDTTLTADDPFADMIKFKQVFRFPYRVKAVDNERAKILSDFKGVELEANMYDLSNNPDFFNIEVLFEE